MNSAEIFFAIHTIIYQILAEDHGHKPVGIYYK